MSHFCRVVCSAIGRTEFGVCIAFVFGIMVTTPEVHVSGIVPASRKRFSDSYICGSKISENLLKNLAGKPSSPGQLLLFNLLRPSCRPFHSLTVANYRRRFVQVGLQSRKLSKAGHHFPYFPRQLRIGLSVQNMMTPSRGMAINTCVPRNMTSQSTQQHTAPHTTGCRHHTACPNTQQITQAAKQPNLPSNQHTIQPTTPTTPHENTTHHNARHVTTTHYPPTQYNTPQPITHYSRPQHGTTPHSTAHHMTRGHNT